jgi:hypothetical protein
VTKPRPLAPPNKRLPLYHGGLIEEAQRAYRRVAQPPWMTEWLEQQREEHRRRKRPRRDTQG